MIKNLILSVIIGTSLLFSSIPVYATEEAEGLGDVNVVYGENEEYTEDQGELPELELEKETERQPREIPERPEETDIEPEYVYNTGDEETVISALNTAFAEDSSCEVDAKGIVPEDFGLNIYINIKNLDTGVIYMIPLYKENSYRQRCYVRPGSYTVTDVSVFEDTTGKYPFTYPDDFNVTDNGSHEIEVTLENYEEVEQEIADRTERYKYTQSEYRRQALFVKARELSENFILVYE